MPDRPDREPRDVLALLPCPVCGRAPVVERCEPLPRGVPPIWSVACYATVDRTGSHFLGGNGDTREEAIAAWNALAQ